MQELYEIDFHPLIVNFLYFFDFSEYLNYIERFIIKKLMTGYFPKFVRSRVVELYWIKTRNGLALPKALSLIINFI